MKISTRHFLAVALIALCPSAHTDEREIKSPFPGFRPESEVASSFVANIKTAQVRVYPTIVRTPTNTLFSSDSREQIVAFLNDKAVTKAVSNETEIDPGDLAGQGQFDWFQNDMAVIGNKLRQQQIKEDYALVMEVLFPPMRGDRQAVFGIHCILLDAEGNNVFSFLLNSHHQLFVDAKMEADDRTEESRNKLVKKASEVGLKALVQQIRLENK